MRVEDTVSGWLTERPATVAPDCTLLEAFRIMAERDVRHVPVVEGGRLVGILSNRDFARALREGSPAGASGRSDLCALESCCVREAMTPAPISVGPLTTIAEAAQAMVELCVSALPVMDGGRLVGIVTTQDLLRALVPLARKQEGAIP